MHYQGNDRHLRPGRVLLSALLVCAVTTLQTTAAAAQQCLGRPNLMFCGNTDATGSDLYSGVGSFTEVFSCAPDANTQALLVTRYASIAGNGPSWLAYLNGGGRIISEYSVAAAIYNELYGTSYPPGTGFGSCSDNAMPEAKLNTSHSFWLANSTIPVTPPGQGGCGYSVTNLVSGEPTVTPLGTVDGQVSFAARNQGAGWYFLLESDWQDSEPSYSNDSKQFMGGLIAACATCNNDGVVDPGEQCDDNNAADGDGCSEFCRVETCWTCSGAPSSCTPEVASTACPDEGNECTTDLCDGAGVCEHSPVANGTACANDGSLCTGDVCVAGTCSHPTAVDCAEDTPCREGTCDPSTGSCGYCPAGYTVGGGGCQKTYPIDASLLNNLPSDCGNGNRYNSCNDQPFGFHWTDTGDGSVGPVVSADVELEAGISCSGAPRAINLNGNPVGNYNAAGACTCGSAHAQRQFSGINVSSYVKGGLNTILTDTPTECEGLSADGDGFFGVVTVTYQSPTAPLLPDGSSCSDAVYCNGTDTCSSGNCDQHSGDPCAGGSECNATCNEAADNCYDLPPTPCTPDSSPCTLDQCNGNGACSHPAGNAGTECRPDGGQCDVAEQCDGTNPTCPPNGFEPSGTPCDDDNVCTQTDQCNGANVCVGSNPMDCSDGDICTADLCDAQDGCDNPGALALNCKTAQKSILILKQNGGAGDKQLFKWVKGESLDQVSELGDPTGTTEYAVCIYKGTSNDVLESFSVPAAGGNWSAIGTKGYKYKEINGSNGGITKVILKGGDALKTKVLVKGKGGNLPDPVLTNLPLPVTAQVINPDTGTCVEAVFDTGDVKKNTDTLFKAKAQ